MSDVPARCPTCTTSIPAGRSRCPGCGRVFGEGNRCPHCHAIAGVRKAGAGHVCMACSKPREVGSGTTILDGSAGPIGPGGGLPEGAAARGRSVGLRGLGVLSVAGGVLAAAVAGAILPGVGGLLVAAALGAVGVGVGALALRAGARQADSATAEQAAARELAILALAEKQAGVLTATDVARELGVSTQEADRSLTSLADGQRVSVELTPDGLVHYEFREVQARLRAGPRVRIDAAALAEEADAEVEEVLADRPDAKARKAEEPR